MADVFHTVLIRKIVAQLLDQSGFQTAQAATLGVLGDVLASTILTLAQSINLAAELAGRTHANISDAVGALRPEELRGWVRQGWADILFARRPPQRTDFPERQSLLVEEEDVLTAFHTMKATKGEALRHLFDHWESTTVIGEGEGLAMRPFAGGILEEYDRTIPIFLPNTPHIPSYMPEIPWDRLPDKERFQTGYLMPRGQKLRREESMEPFQSHWDSACDSVSSELHSQTTELQSLPVNMDVARPSGTSPLPVSQPSGDSTFRTKDTQEDTADIDPLRLQAPLTASSHTEQETGSRMVDSGAQSVSSSPEGMADGPEFREPTCSELQRPRPPNAHESSESPPSELLFPHESSAQPVSCVKSKGFPPIMGSSHARGDVWEIADDLSAQVSVLQESPKSKATLEPSRVPQIPCKSCKDNQDFIEVSSVKNPVRAVSPNHSMNLRKRRKLREDPWKDQVRVEKAVSDREAESGYPQYLSPLELLQQSLGKDWQLTLPASTEDIVDTTKHQPGSAKLAHQFLQASEMCDLIKKRFGSSPKKSSRETSQLFPGSAGGNVTASKNQRGPSTAGGVSLAGTPRGRPAGQEGSSTIKSLTGFPSEATLQGLLGARRGRSLADILEKPEARKKERAVEVGSGADPSAVLFETPHVLPSGGGMQSPAPGTAVPDPHTKASRTTIKLPKSSLSASLRQTAGTGSIESKMTGPKTEASSVISDLPEIILIDGPDCHQSVSTVAAVEGATGKTESEAIPLCLPRSENLVVAFDKPPTDKSLQTITPESGGTSQTAHSSLPISATDSCFGPPRSQSKVNDNKASGLGTIAARPTGMVPKIKLKFGAPRKTVEPQRPVGSKAEIDSSLAPTAISLSRREHEKDTADLAQSPLLASLPQKQSQPSINLSGPNVTVAQPVTSAPLPEENNLARPGRKDPSPSPCA